MISDFGKKTIAVKMFLKGTEFLGAFELLRKNNNYSSFVQIYLLIQGIEILCKGTLLLEDYDKYRPILKSNRKLKIKGFDHNIKNLILEIRKLYGVKPNQFLMFDKEIENLPKDWISLRYGGIIDILHVPNSYKFDCILEGTINTMKYVLKKHQMTFEAVINSRL